ACRSCINCAGGWGAARPSRTASCSPARPAPNGDQSPASGSRRWRRPPTASASPRPTWNCAAWATSSARARAACPTSRSPSLPAERAVAVQVIRALVDSEKIDLIALGEVAPSDVEKIQQALGSEFRTVIDPRSREDGKRDIAVCYRDSKLTSPEIEHISLEFH